MASTEPATEMTPLEYLAAADGKLAAGKGREAAGLLSKAARATFVKLAQRQGLNCSDLDLTSIAKTLEADASLPVLHYRANRIAASLLNDHAKTEVLEDCELEGAYGVVRKFVLGCHSAFD